MSASPRTRGTRARISTVYALSAALPSEPLTDAFQLHSLGRFERNMRKGNGHWFKGARLQIDPGDLQAHCPEHGTNIPFFGAWTYQSRFGSSQLRLDTMFTDATPQELALVLVCSCNDRDGLLTRDNNTLISACTGDRDSTAEFGIDVHSIVSLPEAHADWGRSECIQVIYREQVRRPRPGIPIAEPVELNRFEDHVGMHGRGVTLLIGHDEQTVNACILIAQGLVMLLQQVREFEVRAQNLLKKAQTLASDDSAISQAERIDRIAQLTNEVQRLDVLMSVEVESVFANGSLPEIVLDSYRESLASTLGLRSSIDAAGTTLGKIRGFISSEYERIASEHRERLARRERSRALWAAAASAVVLPTGLLFAYLAIGTNDIDPNASFFSFHYTDVWVVYLVLLSMSVIAVLIFANRKQ